VLLRLAYLGVTTMVGAAATAASQRPTARALDRSDALRPGCIHRRYPRVVVSDRAPLGCALKTQGRQRNDSCVNGDMAQSEPAVDAADHSCPAPARPWWSVLARAAGLVLLCNVIPLAGAGYTWLVIRHPSRHECTECGAFDGVFLVLIVGTVAVSLAVGLLLVGALVVAWVRRPRLIGLVGGAPGLLLSAFAVLQLLYWLLGLIVGD